MVYDGKQNPIFNYINQQPNNIFSKNPLIQELSNDKAWTVSDIEKKPIDAKHLLATGTVRNASLNSTHNPLVSLQELNNNQNLNLVNRTYRLSALENRTFMIDIEPKTDDEILKKWASFPAQYTEISTNGGLHLLIQVPESLINNDNEYIFNTLTVIKEGDHNEIEYLFNRHYITFTKRIPLEKQNATFVEGSVEYEQLKDLLDHLVSLDAHNKEVRQKANTLADELTDLNVNMNIIEPQLPENATSNSLLYNITLANQSFTDQLPNREDCLNDKGTEDLSLYEFRIASKIVRQLIKSIGQIISYGPKTAKLYNESNHILEFTENDIIYLAYCYAKEIIPYREKHDQFRENMPWLLYTAKNAYLRTKAAYELRTADSNKQSKGDQLYAYFYTNATYQKNVSL